MKTTTIKVEVPDTIYQVISNEQAKRREKEGKKTALSEILLEYFNLGLNYSKKFNGNVENPDLVQNFEQNLGGFEQNTSDFAPNSILRQILCKYQIFIFTLSGYSIIN